MRNALTWRGNLINNYLKARAGRLVPTMTERAHAMDEAATTTAVHPTSSWYRCGPAALVMCAGVALSLALFLVARAWEQDRVRAEFARAAASRVHALKDHLDINLHELKSLGALYAASPTVNRSQFREFVSRFLADRPGIQALEWIPRVPDSRRAEYEQAAREDGFAGFQFTDRRAQGQMVRAARRAEYFPVYFVEPYKGNEIALGFDLASNPVRRETLDQSRDTGLMVASARITLVQETGDQFGFLVFLPIYREGAPAGSVAQQRQHLEGFALGVFRIGDILQAALADLKSEGLDIYVFDDSAPVAEQFLTFYSSRARAAPSQLLTAAKAHHRTGPRYAETIAVAGRKWSVSCAATPEYVAARRTWQPWAVLISGLLVSACVSAYLLLVLTGAATARRFTAELLQAKQALEREVAERAQVQEALRQSERDFRTLVEISNDAMIVLDEDGAISLFNPAAERMYGWSGAEMVGQPFDRLLAQGSRSAVMDEMRRRLERIPRPLTPDSFRGLSGPTVEEPCLRRAGEEFTAEISLAVTERRGRLLILAIVRDITERKRAEDALRESERKFRTLLGNLPQKIFYKDRYSVYVSCNDNYARDLKISAGEITGRTDYDFYPQELAEKYRADDKRITDSGTTEDIEEGYIEDGERRWVHTVKTAVRDDSGNIVGVLGIFWDVTERRRMEQALEAKNRELEDFVYTVSHDLRAPLISMEGFARLLAEEYSERLDAEGRDYLRRVRANVGAMDRLLTDLLELSRVGRVEESAEAVDVGEVVAEALEELAGIIKQSGAEVTVAQDLPTARYSPARLCQVFSNLISNAIKFSQPGVAPRIEIGYEPAERAHRFRVKDNGIGIAPAHREKIFQIFGRLQQKKVEGTGIGLAIVKRIVEDHGGEVGVDSAPGAGSTFWFTVPDQGLDILDQEHAL